LSVIAKQELQCYMGDKLSS